MKISIEEINYISKLANLKLNEEETLKMSDEFSEIFGHFDNIINEDLSDFEMYSFDEPSKLREDKVIEFDNKEELFRNVKEMIDTSIKIPKVID